MDAIALVLGSLRLRSAVMTVVHAKGRWGISAGAMERTMVFHGIVSGRCVIRRRGQASQSIEAGDVAFLAHGDAHTILLEDGASVIPIEEAPIRMAGDVPIIEVGAKGDETRIVCAKCTLDHPASSSVLDLLPALLASRQRDETRRRWVLATLELLEQEVLKGGRDASITSLTDALFVHLVAEVAAETETRGLLGAARDPQIGKALALIHANPSGDWTAATLAAKVGMGRTRFFDRFTELVGAPPATYVARWRVLSAADLLRDARLSTLEIAEKVGYANEDALARAFKRHMGQRLGEYRRGRELLPS